MAATVRGPTWPSETPISYPARSRASCARRTTSLVTFAVGRIAAVVFDVPRLPAGAAVLAWAPALRAPPRAGCFLRGAGARAFADIGAHEDPRSAEPYTSRVVPRKLTVA